jgi:hypothetical protein
LETSRQKTEKLHKKEKKRLISTVAALDSALELARQQLKNEPSRGKWTRGKIGED